MKLYYLDIYSMEGAHRELSERFDDVKTVIDLRQGDTVFDIGCAEGLITLEVANTASYVEGIELDKTRYDKAIELKHNSNSNNVAFKNESITEYNLSRSFDVVLLLGVVQHLPNDQDVFSAFTTALSAAE